MPIGASTVLSIIGYLFLKSGLENCREGFGLACLGSYVHLLDQSLWLIRWGIILAKLGCGSSSLTSCRLYEWCSFENGERTRRICFSKRRASPFVFTTPFRGSRVLRGSLRRGGALASEADFTDGRWGFCCPWGLVYCFCAGGRPLGITVPGQCI